MNIKTKILVVLAFIVAAFYTLEVVLTLIDEGFAGPVIVKAGIVAATLYYAISRIAKSRVAKEKEDSA